MTNSVLSLLSSRRSHRAYQPQQLTQEQLDALLTAALASPSAVNRQPWHFTVVQNAALLDEIHQAAKEHIMTLDESQRSPRFLSDDFQVFYHAPTVIFISGDASSNWVQLDCGIAAENIVIAAESMGLGSVVLGLPRNAFASDKGPALKEKLQFPAGYEFVIAVAIGTPADDKAAHLVGDNKISIIRG